MKRFDNFFTVYKAILTGITSVGAVFIQQYLQKLNIPTSIQFIAIAVIGVIFVLAMQVFAETLINGWAYARKLLFGRAYLEGFWVDISFAPDENTVLHGAFSRIYYKDGQIISEDENFDANGEFVGSFEIKSFDYTENSLRYGYKTISPIFFNKDLQFGYGEMQFGVRSGIPQRYSGFYFDSISKKMLFFEGEKLADKDAKKIISNSDERRNFFKNYISTFAQRKGYTLDLHKANNDTPMTAAIETNILDEQVSP